MHVEYVRMYVPLMHSGSTGWLYVDQHMSKGHCVRLARISCLINLPFVPMHVLGDHNFTRPMHGIPGCAKCLCWANYSCSHGLVVTSKGGDPLHDSGALICHVMVVLEYEA